MRVEMQLLMQNQELKADYVTKYIITEQNNSITEFVLMRIKNEPNFVEDPAFVYQRERNEWSSQ